MSSPLDQRLLVVARAGPNGAGKTTFSHTHLKPHVQVFDNDDLPRPFRRIAVSERGRPVSLEKPLPR